MTHEVYLNTIERLEPGIAMIDAGAGYASIAISLKRIADSLEILAGQDHLDQLKGAIELAIWNAIKK